MRITFNESETYALIKLTNKIAKGEYFKGCSSNGSSFSKEEFYKYGVIILDSNNEPTGLPGELGTWVIRNYGKSNAMWQNSFHKSWDKIITTDMETLIAEQIMHYFSTYGLEELGLQAMPQIPVETILTNPDAIPSFKAFTVLKIISLDEANDLAKEVLCSVVNPNADYQLEYKSLIKVVDSVDEIKSYEVKVFWYDYTNTVPEKGKDWIRFTLYKTLNTTLVVNNVRMLRALRSRAEYCSVPLEEYFKKANLMELSKEFNRHKKIFLGFKYFDGCASYVNKISKFAKKTHKPLSGLTIQNLAYFAKEGDMKSAVEIIKKSSLRQLVKAYNYYNYSIDNAYPSCDLYRIRNGGMFVKENKGISDTTKELLNEVFKQVAQEIRDRCSDKLKGNIYYIPSYVSYAVPISEKQFVGNIPTGSAITFGNNCTLAIYWENFKDTRTDIDLHLRNTKEHFGWNSARKDDTNRVLYSGDMTDAKDGAVEAFNFTPVEDEKYILSAFRYLGVNKTPFKFFMTNKELVAGADEKEFACRPKYICSVEDAVFPPIPAVIDGTSLEIGILSDRSFYFTGGTEGNSIIPNNLYLEKALDSQVRRLVSMYNLESLIMEAGGTIIHELPKGDLKINYVDLSPSALDTTTLINIIDSLDNN